MFISTRWHHYRERGDTIVEVLIAIAIVSLILGGAYATTNRSVQTTRAAEERGNALKLAESQVEQLKGLAKSNPSSIFGGATPLPFCIATSTGLPVAASNNACHVNAAGAPTTAQPIFNLSISRASDGNTFTVTNQWIDVSGRITDQLRMIYRVYE
jgi:prepilin-type N-terminal cleavage/methylation domain-containing protein